MGAVQVSEMKRQLMSGHDDLKVVNDAPKSGSNLPVLS